MHKVHLILVSLLKSEPYFVNPQGSVLFVSFVGLIPYWAERISSLSAVYGKDRLTTDGLFCGVCFVETRSGLLAVEFKIGAVWDSRRFQAPFKESLKID